MWRSLFISCSRAAEQIPPGYSRPPPHHAQEQTARAGDPGAEESARDFTPVRNDSWEKFRGSIKRGYLLGAAFGLRIVAVGGDYFLFFGRSGCFSGKFFIENAGLLVGVHDAVDDGDG